MGPLTLLTRSDATILGPGGIKPRAQGDGMRRGLGQGLHHPHIG